MHAVATIIKESLARTVRTALWLLRIMIPVSFAVRILQYVGVIDYVADWLNPLMRLVGLPGESAVAFLTGALVGTHAGLAAMFAMPFTLREGTIMAVMICLCHALLVEGSVVRNLGASFTKLTVLRLVAAFAAAFLLNLVMPDMEGMFAGGEVKVLEQTERSWPGFWDMMGAASLSLLKLTGMMFGIIFIILIIKNAVTHYKLMDTLARPLQPLMRIYGLPSNATYLWIVGNIVGLSYGCGVIKDFADECEIAPDEVRTVSYHLVLNHSMVEDTLLFATFGVNGLWIIGTRMAMATAVVWARHLVKKMRTS
ncbi:MAG: hypothetical protein HUK02_06730 [Bacteroidaceae bacterium]|nr:hypothetical protein [Bacteroidaceae bacterium]